MTHWEMQSGAGVILEALDREGQHIIGLCCSCTVLPTAVLTSQSSEQVHQLKVVLVLKASPIKSGWPHPQRQHANGD